MSELSENGTLEDGVLFLNADSAGSLEGGGAETKTLARTAPDCWV